MEVGGKCWQIPTVEPRMGGAPSQEKRWFFFAKVSIDLSVGDYFFLIFLRSGWFWFLYEKKIFYLFNIVLLFHCIILRYLIIKNIINLIKHLFSLRLSLGDCSQGVGCVHPWDCTAHTESQATSCSFDAPPCCNKHLSCCDPRPTMLCREHSCADSLQSAGD